jgi:hypothetical protein
MTGGNYLALIISALALTISVYGAVERRNVLRQAERQRLASLIIDLDKLHYEQLKSPDGLVPGDFADSINSLRALLSAQALALLPAFTREVTSSELRTLAFALGRAGYLEDGERIWVEAIDKGSREGATQELHARRGYAYFLWNAGRADDAGSAMRAAVDSLPPTDDHITEKIETFKFWANGEFAAAPERRVVAEELLAEARQLVTGVTSSRLRTELYRLLDGPSPWPTATDDPASTTPP